MRKQIQLDDQFQSYYQDLFASDCPTKNQITLQILLDQAKAFSSELGLSDISISASDGRLIQFLVRQNRCKKFVEIGVLTGYSALWIASGMQQGTLYALEKAPEHAALARKIFAQFVEQYKGKSAESSGVKIELLEGDAQQTLQQLAEQGPFDGIFIDGNKSAYLDYLKWAEIHLAPGGLLLADNVFQSGAVWLKDHKAYNDKSATVMREFNQRIAQSGLFDSSILPTSDGLFIAVKKDSTAGAYSS